MTKYAFNKDGVLHDVVQTHPSILFAPEYAVQFVEVPDDAQNGDLWDGETLTRPLPEQPKQPKVTVVTMRQARLALLDLDLLSSIDEAINAMPEPDKTKAKIEWEYAAVVERNSDWVSDLGQQLGLSDTQIDDLFRLAATK